MSSGALKTAGVTLTPIQTTRSEVMALAAAGRLKAGSIYAFEIDPNFYSGITGYFLALTSSKLSQEGNADFLNAKFQIDGSFANPLYIFIGVYGYTGGTRTANQVYQLNNCHYVRLTTGPDSDPRADSTNWLLLPRSTNNGYVKENCPIKYDIKNDKIIYRSDSRGNIYSGGELKYFAWGNDQVHDNFILNSNIKNCNTSNAFYGNNIQSTNLIDLNNSTQCVWTNSKIVGCNFADTSSGQIQNSTIEYSTFDAGGYGIFNSTFIRTTHSQLDGTFTNCTVNDSTLNTIQETDFENCIIEQTSITNCQSATVFMGAKFSGCTFTNTNGLIFNDVDLRSLSISSSTTVVITSSTFKFCQIANCENLNISLSSFEQTSFNTVTNWQVYKCNSYNFYWSSSTGNNSTLNNCYFRNYNAMNVDHLGESTTYNGHKYTENEIEVSWKFNFFGASGTGLSGDMFPTFTPIMGGYNLDYLYYRINGGLGYVALTKFEVKAGDITLIPEQSVEYLPSIYMNSTPTSGLTSNTGSVTARVTSDGETGQIFSGTMEFRIRLKKLLVV